MNENKFHEIAFGVARAHILNINAKFDFIFIDKQKGSYLALISHPLLSSNIEEIVNTHNMSAQVAEDYVHCRIHGLAAKLLAKLYPEKA